MVMLMMMMVVVVMELNMTVMLALGRMMRRHLLGLLLLVIDRLFWFLSRARELWNWK